MRAAITSEDGPAAYGPFSQAIKANGFIFVSGQIAIDPATGKLIDGGIEEQTERTLANIAAILEAAGSDLRDVVRCVVYLTDMSDFAAMNAIYARHFPIDPPARTTTGAGTLLHGAIVEIEVTALAR